MRRKLSAPALRRNTKPSWMVEEQGERKTGWEITTDKNGQNTHRQLTPPNLNNQSYMTEHCRSSWVLEITESCYVGGNSTNVGDKIHCYTPACSELLAAGRGKIISEQKNAF